MINYWLTVTDAMYADMALYVNDPESYAGSHPAADVAILLNGLHDPISVSSMFKPHDGKRLLSVYVTNQSLFNSMLTRYPQVSILGGWDMSGTITAQVNSETINYMPDVFVLTNEETGDVIYQKATSLAQVNTISGQGARAFS